MINDRNHRLSRRMRLDGLVLSVDRRYLTVTGSLVDKDSGHWLLVGNVGNCFFDNFSVVFAK